MSLAIEFLGFVVAAACIAFGIRRLHIGLLVGGGAIAGLVWLASAWSTDDEWTRHELVDLRLRPIDAVNGAAVPGVTIEAIEPDENRESSVYRLPSTTYSASSGEAPTVVTVSIVVELRITGSFVQQYRRPAAHIEMMDQQVRFRAPGYQPLPCALKELLPEGWPLPPIADRPIVVEMQPEPTP